MPERRLSLLESVSLNMSLMVGIGPFITLPALVGTLGGPQSMIGWVLGGLVALADGMVWSELAAAFPGRGGPITSTTRPMAISRSGRILKFLFVWQFLFSGPLEMATGAIGLAKYLGYFFPVLAMTAWNWGSSSLARRAGRLGPGGRDGRDAVRDGARLSADCRCGPADGRALGGDAAHGGLGDRGGRLTHFDAAHGLRLSRRGIPARYRMAMGLGMALAIAMYDYFGYYQVCYLADEVADAVADDPALDLDLGDRGRARVPDDEHRHPGRRALARRGRFEAHRQRPDAIAVYGRGRPGWSTMMIIWTALASVFAAMLGYSRIPYASARAGAFLQSVRHAPSRPAQFPHRSLLLIGGLAALACLADLKTVIDALVASRIPIQFVGQIVTVFYLRLQWKERPATFRMPFSRFPALIALAGWLFIFSERQSGWSLDTAWARSRPAWSLS